MSVKDELNKIRVISRLIDSDQRQIKELEHLKLNIKSPTITGMPKQKGFTESDKLESIIVKIDKLEEDIRSNAKELVELRNYWLVETNKLDYADQLLIKLRYFENMSWQEVASDMNYDIRQVHRHHGRILQKMSLNVTKCHI